MLNRVSKLAASWHPGCAKTERERENEKIQRGNGERMRFTLYISSFSLSFLPLYPFPITKIVTIHNTALSSMSPKTYKRAMRK